EIRLLHDGDVEGRRWRLGESRRIKDDLVAKAVCALEREKGRVANFRAVTKLAKQHRRIKEKYPSVPDIFAGRQICLSCCGIGFFLERGDRIKVGPKDRAASYVAVFGGGPRRRDAERYDPLSR